MRELFIDGLIACALLIAFHLIFGGRDRIVIDLAFAALIAITWLALDLIRGPQG